MVEISIQESTGGSRTIVGEAGTTLMQTLRDSAIADTLGECGGFCACGTCHVFIDLKWREKLPEIADEEAAMLDGIANSNEASRLSCQIVLVPELNGLTVTIAPVF